MIKTAAQKPGERKEYLQKCLRDFADLPNDPVVKSFGMTVDPSFLKVSPRHLWSAATTSVGPRLISDLCATARPARTQLKA
jgi:hypothetical protein